MNKKTLLVGEPMGLFIAQNKGSLDEVGGYSMAIAGAEFNVAVGMTRLGHSVGYYTKLGRDPFGMRIYNAMNRNHISTDLITFSNECVTGFMLKSMVETGDPEIFYYRKNSAASTLCPADIEALDFDAYDAIHMTGITPAISDTARQACDVLAETANQRGMLLSFDPNLRPQLWPSRGDMVRFMNAMAARCDIFLPGIQEAKILSGLSDPQEIAETYLKTGAKAVIIKMGGKGAYFATPKKSGLVPGFQVTRIVDTVGAGDGFAAGVLTAMKEGLPIEQAIRRGNAVGAIQVMSRGDNDGLPTKQEVEDFMNGKPAWRKSNEG